MARHRTPPETARAETARGSDAGRDERHRLEVTFGAAGVDPAGLDRARRTLLARLSSHADDFAATAALQALNRYSAGLRTDNPSDAPGRVRETGLSFLQRMRSKRASATA
jgi:hypothetical protein